MTDATLSAVLPAFNEEANLPTAVSGLSGVLRELPLLEWEIVIVNNASTDRTGEVADRYARMDPSHVRVVHNPSHVGYAGSLKLGLASARHELLFYTDADNQCDVRYLPRLLAMLEAADFATGFRFDRQDPWLRRVLSSIFNWAVRVGFTVSTRDANCAFRLFRRRVLESMTLESAHGFISAELVVKANRYGFSVAETEVPHRPRMLGRSTIGLQVLYRTFLDYIRVWRSMRHERGPRSQAMVDPVIVEQAPAEKS